MNYFAATWIGPVAEKVAEQLVAWGVDPGSLNLIGHSLGAYLSAEIAYQVKSKSPAAEKVDSLTLLDPGSDYNPPNIPLLTALGYGSLLPLINFGRYQNGYVYSRTGVGDVHPPSPQDVAQYSRAFLGRTSIAGSVEASSETNEAFLIDFGPGSGTNLFQHLNVALTFRNLIDSTRPNLADDLLELGDNRPHPDFQQNFFVASDILQRPAFEGVLLADSSGNIKGFYAKRANIDGFHVYGTDGDDRVIISPNPGRSQPGARLNGMPVDSQVDFGNNIYYLGAGSDILRGKDGNDLIFGDFEESDSPQLPQAGVTYNDTIDAGAGNDEVYGGLGDDRIEGNRGNDLLCGDNLNDSKGGNDRLSGDDGDDSLFGDAGNDQLLGGSGEDFATGGTGNDRLFGNQGNDWLPGGDGDDWLSGSDGSGQTEVDKLIGGTGTDRFILGNRETAFYQGQKDADYADILDFNPSESDIIQLHGSRQNYSFKQQGNAVQIRYHDKPQPRDGVLLSDLTKSFRNDLTTVKRLMPALAEKLQASYQDIRLGFSSFTDAAHDWDFKGVTREKYTEFKPAGKDQWGYDQYVEVERTKTTRSAFSFYQRGYIQTGYTDLTSDLAVPLAAINGAESHLAWMEGTATHSNPETGYTSITKLVDRDDLDPSEAQLDALLSAARDPNLRPQATKIAIITTDAPFHQAGDGRKEVLGSYWWNWQQGYRAKDYISIAELRTALIEADVVPIFAVTKSVQNTYDDLVEQLGRGAVVTLSANPNKLMNAVSDAIEGDLVGVVRSATVEQVLAQSRYAA